MNESTSSQDSNDPNDNQNLKDRIYHKHKKLKNLTIKEKLAIIQKAKINGNRPCARQFGVLEKLIRYWRKNIIYIMNDTPQILYIMSCCIVLLLLD